MKTKVLIISTESYGNSENRNVGIVNELKKNNIEVTHIAPSAKMNNYGFALTTFSMEKSDEFGITLFDSWKQYRMMIRDHDVIVLETNKCHEYVQNANLNGKYLIQHDGVCPETHLFRPIAYGAMNQNKLEETLSNHTEITVRSVVTGSTQYEEMLKYKNKKIKKKAILYISNPAGHTDKVKEKYNKIYNSIIERGWNLVIKPHPKDKNKNKLIKSYDSNVSSAVESLFSGKNIKIASEKRFLDLAESEIIFARATTSHLESGYYNAPICYINRAEFIFDDIGLSNKFLFLRENNLKATIKRLNYGNSLIDAQFWFNKNRVSKALLGSNFDFIGCDISCKEILTPCDLIKTNNFISENEWEIYNREYSPIPNELPSKNVAKLIMDVIKFGEDWYKFK